MKPRLIFITISALLLTCFISAPAFANVNDFSFSSATFDYYLSKNDDKTSHMEVKETITALFPNHAQNHGINRCLPTHYRGVNSLNKNSFAVSRAEQNSSPQTEPFSTYEEDNLLCFRIGSASSYVTGEQTYYISYTLDNVILQPSDSSNQELYWDTNGTGWFQPFASLTATVYFYTSQTNLADGSANSAAPNIYPSSLTGSPSCYVGAFGASGPSATSRCSITTPNDSGLFSNNDYTPVATFSTSDLAPGENLTFNLVFAPNTFAVKKDWRPLLIAVLAALSALALSIASFFAHRRAKARNAEKLSLASAPKPVQYLPPKDLTVAQANELWLHTSTADSKIATLMELAVRHHIQLEKTESDRKLFKSAVWKIHVLRASGLSTDQNLVLQILNHGKPVATGDVIVVKTQSYSSKVAKLFASFSSSIVSDLKNKHLYEDKSAQKFYLLAPKYNKYEKRTLKGIEFSNYLDGLKEYISLAEADRIKFLHSVNTADVSSQGIVKLYEKLLPYAIIFGCEESWLAELEKYYRLPDVSDPTYMLHGAYLSSRDFRAFRTATSSSISSASASTSSGSSGSGGGGFSGGGGGGGGGGGW